MSLHEGPALVAAAIRAAILARAPRRTVAAVAAAMVGALHRPAAQPPPPSAREPAETQFDTTAGLAGASPEVLVDALREARAAKRRKKKERRRANRSSREGTGKDEGQAFTENALRCHDVATAVVTSRPGGGSDGPSCGSPPREPPCKIPRVDIRGVGETPHVPPLPAIEDGLKKAPLFSLQVQVAGPNPAGWENLPPGLTEELAKYGIVDYSRSHDPDGKPCFQYSDTKPERPARAAEAVIKAIVASVESRSGHEGEQRVAGTPETGKTRPRKRAGKKR